MAAAAGCLVRPFPGFLRPVTNGDATVGTSSRRRLVGAAGDRYAIYTTKGSSKTGKLIAGFSNSRQSAAPFLFLFSHTVVVRRAT